MSVLPARASKVITRSVSKLEPSGMTKAEE